MFLLANPRQPGILRLVAFRRAVSTDQVAGNGDERQTVEKLGGKVTRDEKAEGKPVIRVRLGGTQVTDAGLKELAALKNLQELDLAGTKVTDAGLKELAALKTLQTLYLDNTKVTDAGLKELAPLKNLQTLYLGNTQVTDAGKAELRKALPKCQVTP